MKVPLLDLQAQYASIRRDVLAAITRELASTYKGRTAGAMGLEPPRRTRMCHQSMAGVPNRDAVRTHLPARNVVSAVAGALG